MPETKANNTPPKVLTDVGLNMFVDTVKLGELSLPVIDLDIEKLVWHFDMPVWHKDGTDNWNLTPWEVIGRVEGSAAHQERVKLADVTYPILVADYKSRLVILDGVHRLVKVYQNNGKTIKAKVVPAEYLSRKEFQT